MDSKETIQSFLPPGEKTFCGSGVLPQSPYYLIHPVLNALINEQSGKYEINDINIIEDGISWTALSTRKCSFNKDYPCKREKILNPQGVFLASSSENKKIVTELCERLKSISINFDVDIWTHNKGETGIIFCNEVCPKIYDNFWMIAEISDLNPNVLFECGFAAGVGRFVTLIRNKENAPDMRLNLIYTSYTTLDMLVTKLKNISKKLPINKKIYGVPSIFDRIGDFESPEKRKKSDKVFVLSFDQNNEIIKSLKANGYFIVEKNRLIHKFMSVDLIDDIINAKALLVNLSGEEDESDELNQITVNDCKLMYLAGVCVAQGVPVKIFQNSNNKFYSDVDSISLFVDSADPLFVYVDKMPLFTRRKN